MSLGERLLELRKRKHLSQEEVADKLNVSRQTISKWESDQSMPDFDKITPLCKLFEITADELLTGNASEKKEEITEDSTVKTKRAKGIAVSVFLYFVAVVWIMVAIPVLTMNPIVASAIFLIIIALATSYIIYTCIIYSKKKEEEIEKTESKNTQLIKQIESVVSLIVLIIYLLVSFITMAWHITWLIWIIYALIMEIIKLVLSFKGEYNEEE